MSADNKPCADPARLFIFENLSAFFLRDEPTTIGTCQLCGATGIPVMKADKNTGKGTCAAQSALTQKRSGVADGQPLAFGAELKEGKGSYSLADTAVGILVTEDKSVFTGKVAPTAPLPTSVEASSDLTFFDLLNRVMTDPPDSFYIAEFNKKADFAFSRSDADEFMINGGQAAVRLDRSRLIELVALIEEFGWRAVVSARDLKEKLPAHREKSIRDYLTKNAPALLDRLREAPHGEEPEFEYASGIAYNRAKRTTDLGKVN